MKYLFATGSIRTRLLAALISAAFAFGLVVMHANSLNHNTTGTGGTDSSGTHSLNPAHTWTSFGAGGGGTTTSGGRYHDTCGSTVCHGAFSPSDWAMDISASGGSTARLYLNYGGSGAGGTKTVDNNNPIYVEAKVVGQGNFRNPATNACYWQKYSILSTYYDTSGGYHYRENVGDVWMAHIYLFNNSLNSYISPNASRANPYGSGTIYYINGVAVGTVFNGSDTSTIKCSTGPHIHQESYSTHSWGAEFEWHSCSGKDGYSGLAGISDHVHGDGYTCGSTGYSATYVSQGQVVGYVGGGTTLFWMRDNPSYTGF